ncbi:MAG TPA: MATE family efflux transporter [Candidatus Tectomicrobia bacterium]
MQRPSVHAGSYREVIGLAFPVVLSMVSQTLRSAVNTALLGHFGTVEQGAAGLGAAMLWPFFLLCNCGGVGVNICVAQYIGAQRRPDCGAVTWQGLYLSLLAWLPMLVAGLCAPLLVQLSAPSPELLAPTALYLRILLLGGLPELLSFTLVSFFRGLGDTKTPLLVTLGTQLLNILLDVLLIFGVAGFPRLGVAGAALATVSAETAGLGVYVMLFLRRAQGGGLLMRSWVPFDSHACRHLAQVSWPIGVQRAIEMGAWTLFTTLIARLGAVEAAAHAVATQIMAVSYMAGYGVSIAATTLVGQYLGARNLPAARRSTGSCLVLVLLLMGSLGLGFFVWRQPLTELFTRDQAVRLLSAHLLLFVALFQVFDGVGLIAMGVLRGAGDTRWPMVVGVVLNWVLFVPVATLVIFAWQGGISGGWSAALGYVVALGVVLLYRVWRGDWQHRALV